MTQPFNTDLHLKIASEADEFEQIHQLNYRTFVEEIPQHLPNAEMRLIDKFHTQNTYVIALRGKQLVGMLALRSQRPFSIDAKLPHLDQYLPPCKTPVECRLLAVAPEARKTSLFLALIGYSIKYSLHHQYDLLIISGITKQLKMYTRFGFEPFGTLVGSENTQYQPMFLTTEAYEKVLSRNEALCKIMRGVIYEPQ